METVAVVGLGYVGLPLAVAFGTKTKTIGLDLNEEKLSAYRGGNDPSGEVSTEQLKGASLLQFSSDSALLSEADIIIVVVPTPIDNARRPDLSPLGGACRAVAKHMKSEAIVVFESTVYPGCTEEFCVPILEEGSGLLWRGRCGDGLSADDSKRGGFYVGYSPERINPGDKEHRLESITKVVSGDTADTLSRLSALYGEIIQAGIFEANSIKVAEAAKVIENTQRDLNISLMNELSLIFHRLDIDTADVLEAAGTKWNFLPFKPGLVGGHCIGVDPYYLTYRAEAAGYHPQVILAGRHINDGMGKFIAEQTIKCLSRADKPINHAKVSVLGLTFKEDCPDLRNSHVIDIINELQDYQCDIYVHDPLASKEEALHEYGIELSSWDDLRNSDAIVLAVPHAEYRKLAVLDLKSFMNPGAILIDVKSYVDREDLDANGVNYWRL
ncbi:MAG: nucleotide sugar dehydrogenase [Cellvibrionaceae bacterium]